MMYYNTVTEDLNYYKEALLVIVTIFLLLVLTITYNVSQYFSENNLAFDICV